MPRIKIADRWRIVAALLFALVAPQVSAEDALIFGVFPRRNMAETIAFYTPMAQYLAQELKRPVHVVSAKDFAEFWRGVEERRYDLVHYNQYHYVRSHRRLGYDAIAKIEEDGHGDIVSVIVARQGSGIRTLPDLRHHILVFGGGRDAMQSYILPTYLLRKAGLRAGDYTEKFARNPPNAILTLTAEQADAAGTTETCMRESRVDRERFVELARSAPLAQLPIAVKHEMPGALRSKIQTLLTRLHASAAGRTILERAKISGISAASDADYNPHRNIIHQALGERY